MSADQILVQQLKQALQCTTSLKDQLVQQGDQAVSGGNRELLCKTAEKLEKLLGEMQQLCFGGQSNGDGVSSQSVTMIKTHRACHEEVGRLRQVILANKDLFSEGELERCYCDHPCMMLQQESDSLNGGLGAYAAVQQPTSSAYDDGKALYTADQSAVAADQKPEVDDTREIQSSEPLSQYSEVGQGNVQPIIELDKGSDQQILSEFEVDQKEDITQPQNELEILTKSLEEQKPLSRGDHDSALASADNVAADEEAHKLDQFNDEVSKDIESIDKSEMQHVEQKPLSDHDSENIQLEADQIVFVKPQDYSAEQAGYDKLELQHQQSPELKPDGYNNSDEIAEQLVAKPADQLREIESFDKSQLEHAETKELEPLVVAALIREVQDEQPVANETQNVLDDVEQFDPSTLKHVEISAVVVEDSEQQAISNEVDFQRPAELLKEIEEFSPEKLSHADTKETDMLALVDDAAVEALSAQQPVPQDLLKEVSQFDKSQLQAAPIGSGKEQNSEVAVQQPDFDKQELNEQQTIQINGEATRPSDFLLNDIQAFDKQQLDQVDTPKESFAVDSNASGQAATEQNQDQAEAKIPQNILEEVKNFDQSQLSHITPSDSLTQQQDLSDMQPSNPDLITEVESFSKQQLKPVETKEISPVEQSAAIMASEEDQTKDSIVPRELLADVQNFDSVNLSHVEPQVNETVLSDDVGIINVDTAEAPADFFDQLESFDKSQLKPSVTKELSPLQSFKLDQENSDDQVPEADKVIDEVKKFDQSQLKHSDTKELSPLDAYTAAASKDSGKEESASQELLQELQSFDKSELENVSAEKDTPFDEPADEKYTDSLLNDVKPDVLLKEIQSFDSSKLEHIEPNEVSALDSIHQNGDLELNPPNQQLLSEVSQFDKSDLNHVDLPVGKQNAALEQADAEQWQNQQPKSVFTDEQRSEIQNFDQTSLAPFKNNEIVDSKNDAQIVQDNERSELQAAAVMAPEQQKQLLQQVQTFDRQGLQHVAVINEPKSLNEQKQDDSGIVSQNLINEDQVSPQEKIQDNVIKQFEVAEKANDKDDESSLAGVSTVTNYEPSDSVRSLADVAGGPQSSTSLTENAPKDKEFDELNSVQDQPWEKLPEIVEDKVSEAPKQVVQESKEARNDPLELSAEDMKEVQEWTPQVEPKAVVDDSANIDQVYQQKSTTPANQSRDDGSEQQIADTSVERQSQDQTTDAVHESQNAPETFEEQEGRASKQVEPEDNKPQPPSFWQRLIGVVAPSSALLEEKPEDGDDNSKLSSDDQIVAQSVAAEEEAQVEQQFDGQPQIIDIQDQTETSELKEPILAKQSNDKSSQEDVIQQPIDEKVSIPSNTFDLIEEDPVAPSEELYSNSNAESTMPSQDFNAAQDNEQSAQSLFQDSVKKAPLSKQGSSSSVIEEVKKVLDISPEAFADVKELNQEETKNIDPSVSQPNTAIQSDSRRTSSPRRSSSPRKLSFWERLIGKKEDMDENGADQSDPQHAEQQRVQDSDQGLKELATQFTDDQSAKADQPAAVVDTNETGSFLVKSIPVENAYLVDTDRKNMQNAQEELLKYKDTPDFATGLTELEQEQIKPEDAVDNELLFNNQTNNQEEVIEQQNDGYDTAKPLVAEKLDDDLDDQVAEVELVDGEKAQDKEQPVNPWLQRSGTQIVKELVNNPNAWAKPSSSARPSNVKEKGFPINQTASYQQDAKVTEDQIDSVVAKPLEQADLSVADAVTTEEIPSQQRKVHFVDEKFPAHQDSIIGVSTTDEDKQSFVVPQQNPYQLLENDAETQDMQPFETQKIGADEIDVTASGQDTTVIDDQSADIQPEETRKGNVIESLVQDTPAVECLQVQQNKSSDMKDRLADIMDQITKSQTIADNGESNDDDTLVKSLQDVNDSTNESQEATKLDTQNEIRDSADMIAQSEQAIDKNSEFPSTSISASEPNLNMDDSKDGRLDAKTSTQSDTSRSLDKLLDECLDMVKEDQKETEAVLEKNNDPVVASRSDAMDDNHNNMTAEQLQEVENNPFIPESVKATIRAMAAKADEPVISELESLRKENAELKEAIKLKDIEISQLKSDNADLDAYATDLEKDNQMLSNDALDAKIENQKIKAGLQAARDELADLHSKLPESSLMIVEKKQIIDMEALDMIGRLKGIWKSLMVLYIEDTDMPEINSITEVNFILDQIEISVQIVGSHVDGVKEIQV